MYKTIEALYKNGRIYPIGKAIPIMNARVLLTILDADEQPRKKPSTKKLSLSDLTRLAGSITLTMDPLKIQRKMRNEW
jgi:hypothetical protein